MENKIEKKTYEDNSLDKMTICKQDYDEHLSELYYIKCENEEETTFMLFSESDMKQIATDILEMLEE